MNAPRTALNFPPSMRLSKKSGGKFFTSLRSSRSALMVFAAKILVVSRARKESTERTDWCLWPHRSRSNCLLGWLVKK